MKVTQHIAEAKRTLFSMEVLPPLKGQKIDSIYQTMDELMEFEPAFVDVTYHREEYVLVGIPVSTLYRLLDQARLHHPHMIAL